ncbi:MAG: hypothetical protein RR532_09985, partial [Erysipelothrix sp.]
MKRLISFSLVLIIILAGCSKKETEDTKEPEKPKPTVVEKIDESKDYIYSEVIRDGKTLDGIQIDEITEENKDEKTPDYLPKLLNGKTNYTLEKIVFNFKGVHSKVHGEDYSALIDTYLEEEKEYPQTGHTFVLADYAETEDTISIIIRDKYLTLHNLEGIKSSYSALVFNKKTGDRMTNEEVLAHLNLKIDDITSSLMIKSVSKKHDTDTIKTLITKNYSECNPGGAFKKC